MSQHREQREGRVEGSPEVSYHEHGILALNQWRVVFHVKRGDGHQNPCVTITATHEGQKVFFLDFREGILEKVEAFEAGRLILEEVRAAVETHCYVRVFKKEKQGDPYFYVVLQNSHSSKKNNKPITPGFLAQYCC